MCTSKKKINWGIVNSKRFSKKTGCLSYNAASFITKMDHPVTERPKIWQVKLLLYHKQCFHECNPCYVQTSCLLDLRNSNYKQFSLHENYCLFASWCTKCPFNPPYGQTTFECKLAVIEYIPSKTGKISMNINLKAEHQQITDLPHPKEWHALVMAFRSGRLEPLLVSSSAMFSFCMCLNTNNSENVSVSMI